MAKTKKTPPKPLHGYPKKKKFQTMDEVNTYFDNDTLTCLLCGREYISLHKHLEWSHKMHADAYKELFGIPWGRGLISRTLKERQAAIIRKQIADGVLKHGTSEEQIENLDRMRAKKRRPLSMATIDRLHRNGLNAHGQSEKLSRKSFNKFLKRIKSGRTIADVCKDEDMPNRTTFDVYCRENQDFKDKLEEIWDSVPFDVQVRGQKTGPRFKQTLVELRSKGLSWPEVGKSMGINEKTACSTWARLKRNGELKTFLEEINTTNN